MLVLGIETSCDECAVAVVKDGKTILSNIIHSQTTHQNYGGVVPEIASREHLDSIRQIFKASLSEANIKATDLHGIAVSSNPGLIGSLIVGYNFAKSLSISLDIPFVGINHIHAHIYASHIENDIPYSYISLLLSGGHSLISIVNGYKDIQIIGSTLDDSCGEAFDKVAKFYQIGYPGGQSIDKLATAGDAEAFCFPYPKTSGYNMSYSGLKNAVINQKDKFYCKGDKSNADISASFQKVAIESALNKFFQAMDDHNIDFGCVGGGVGANSYLRKIVSQSKRQIFIPSTKLCTDNGVMVAGLGYHYLNDKIYSSIDEVVNPRKIRPKL